MRELTYREAINEALAQALRRDKDVFLAGEDIGKWGGAFQVTAGLADQFGPERVRDTPISEGAYVGLALGAAATGLRPCVELQFIDFLTFAMDQVVNQAAKMKYMFGGHARLPLTVRAPCGGGVGAAAQHSQMLEAWLCHVPGLKLAIPSTPYDAKGLLLAAIQDDDPVIFIEHKLLYGVKGPVPEEEYTIPLGQAEVKRPGQDVTLIVWSNDVRKALEAAERLAEQGIQAEVIDPRTLVPLDRDAILESVKKTRRVVIVHEAVKFCGVGAEIGAMIAEEAFDYLDAPLKRVAAPYTPVPFSPVLEREYLTSADKIVSAVEELVGVAVA